MPDEFIETPPQSQAFQPPVCYPEAGRAPNLSSDVSARNSSAQNAPLCLPSKEQFERLFIGVAVAAALIKRPTALPRVYGVVRRHLHRRRPVQRHQPRKIASKPLRIKRARAIHSPVAHGGSPAPRGDGGSGSSDGATAASSRSGPRVREDVPMSAVRRSPEETAPSSSKGRASVRLRSPWLTADAVRRLLDYNPDTGIFRWRKRAPSMFRGGARSPESSCKSWNTRYAGKIAGVSNQGYIQIGIDQIGYLAERLAWLIMAGEWPTEDINHANNNRDDNTWSNLRSISNSEVGYNYDLRRNNKSWFKGVSFDPSRGNYQAHATVNCRQYNLGRFRDPKDASRAYDKFAIENHGEFARPNFPVIRRK
jgi:hypothetical protein